MATTAATTGYIPGWDKAAEYVGVSRATLHRAEKAGLLKPLRVGSRVLFTAELLDDFIRRSAGEPTADDFPNK